MLVSLLVTEVFIIFAHFSLCKYKKYICIYRYTVCACVHCAIALILSFLWLWLAWLAGLAGLATKPRYAIRIYSMAAIGLALGWLAPEPELQ